MGKLEEKNRKIVRKTRMQRAILLTIASGGRLGASTLVPEVMNVLFNLDIDTSLSRKSDIIRSAASRLKKKGLVTFESGRYQLTTEGERILKSWHTTDYKITRPKRWDKKWRIVVFDIPEKKRRIRDEIRRIFIDAGFKRLQDSVWVYPYDCEDIIGLLKTDFGIGRDLLYVIADQIENDKYLRDEFGLLSL